MSSDLLQMHLQSTSSLLNKDKNQTKKKKTKMKLSAVGMSKDI